MLAASAKTTLRSIYEPGFAIAKAGVMLLDLQSCEFEQCELALADDPSEDRSRLMFALDALNQRYGKGTVHCGSAGTARQVKSWGMKQERRTPQYTTRWEDVPIARA